MKNSLVEIHLERTGGDKGLCHFMGYKWAKICSIVGGSIIVVIIIIIIIIIINIQGWAIWPVLSPDLQLLSPLFLWSTNCSLSLWSVVK
jgi:hypothetical protein